MKLLLFFALVGAMAASPIHRDGPTIFLVGDSTVADKPDPATNPERGWGQMLPRFFEGATVRNFAVNGRSTKSFIDEGKWAAVVDQLKRGDVVLIEFGHNDEKVEDSTRYTNPYTGYRHNLERFVGEARARGATPVLCSPIVRRKFNDHGVLEDTHGAYPLVVRDVARDSSVLFLDLQLATEELVARAGPEGSKALYVWVAPNTNTMYPQGRQDDTHLSVAGATEVARMVATRLKTSGLPIGKYVKVAVSG